MGTGKGKSIFNNEKLYYGNQESRNVIELINQCISYNLPASYSRRYIGTSDKLVLPSICQNSFNKINVKQAVQEITENGFYKFDFAIESHKIYELVNNITGEYFNDGGVRKT